MKTEKEFEILGRAIEATEDPISAFADDFRRALINEFKKEGITEEMLFGEELCCFYHERSLHERIGRMDLVERLTAAAANCAGAIDNTVELRDFHEALVAAGFDFWKGVRKYLSIYYMLNSHLF